MGKYTLEFGRFLLCLSPRMELSVIIVTYNVQPYLEQCLYALRGALSGHDAGIWVVDNASGDGTADWLGAAFPDIHCIRSTENLGFARANNLPLPDVSGKYILYLNPDTLLQEDCLDKCLAFMETRADAGALGIRMVNGFGAFLRESKRGLPTAAAALFKMTGLADRYPKQPLLSAYYAGHLDDRTIASVPVLPGAFLLVKAAVIREMGGFDERFFMFGEDIDLSYRISRAGWRNYYLPEAVMIHFKGQSYDKASKGYKRDFYGAMTLFIQKYYRGPFGFLYRQLLQSGVFLEKGLGGLLRKLLPGKPRHWTPETARTQWLIVGSRSDTAAFLQAYDPGKLFYLLFHPEETPIERLHGYMGFDGSMPLLFCMGDLTYREVIHWMDTSGWEPPCFFHNRRSEGIVGPDKSWPIPFRRRTPLC
jgi:GT2 family glycosyltransferase